MKLIGQLTELKDELKDKYEENKSKDVRKDYIAVCDAIKLIEDKNRIIKIVAGICITTLIIHGLL